MKKPMFMSAEFTSTFALSLRYIITFPGRSSLHQAVAAGHKDVVEVLLKYKALLQLKDKKGDTR